LFGTVRVMSVVREAAQPARRDFIIQAAQGFVGVGSGLALWPFIDQMNPNKGTPGPEVREVDLSAIRPGQTITVPWRGMPVLIRNRTPEAVRIARKSSASELPDRLARNEALPKTAPADDANRTKEGHSNWLVVIGICTHMGCCSNRRMVLLQSLRGRVGSVPVMRHALTCRGVWWAVRRARIFPCRATNS
jgi:ubiquinol-cytochrome c reductase iron-sulfur subunit